MEEKKSEKADLQKKRFLYFEVGLIVSLTVAILCFAWGTDEKPVAEVEPALPFGVFGITEITPSTQQQRPSGIPPRQSIQHTADVIRIIMDDKMVANEIDFNEFNESDIYVETAEPGWGSGTAGGTGSGLGEGEPFGSDDDTIFIKVEENPKFQGQDWSTFPAWVAKNVEYPEWARREGIQGRVILRFVIEKDGSLSNIEVLSSPNKQLSDAAVAVLKKSPKWTPGQQLRKPVRVMFEVPVDFRLR